MRFSTGLRHFRHSGAIGEAGWHERSVFGCEPLASLHPGPGRFRQPAAYLTDRFKISRAETEERLALQNEISALAYQLAEQNPEQFGGIFIDQEPTYKIVVLFTDAETRDALRQAVSPQLRRYLQIRSAKRSEAESRAIVDRLSKTLADGGVRAIVALDHRNQKFEVTVAEDARLKAVSALIPADLAPDVVTKVGTLPREFRPAS